MIDRDGRVRMLDFGIARARDRSGRASRRSPSRYLSPERMAGAQPGRSCDVWALGAVLAEMLGADPSAARRERNELLQNPLVPRELSELVGGMLAPARNTRVTDLADIRARLSAAAADERALSLWWHHVRRRRRPGSRASGQ